MMWSHPSSGPSVCRPFHLAIGTIELLKLRAAAKRIRVSSIPPCDWDSVEHVICSDIGISGHHLWIISDCMMHRFLRRKMVPWEWEWEWDRDAWLIRLRHCQQLTSITVTIRISTHHPIRRISVPTDNGVGSGRRMLGCDCAPQSTTRVVESSDTRSAKGGGEWRHRPCQIRHDNY